MYTIPGVPWATHGAYRLICEQYLVISVFQQIIVVNLCR